MKRKMMINEKAKIMHVPTEVVEQGYKGEIDALMNARTITIIHPEASLEEVKRSLEIVLEDVKLRIDSEKRQSQNAEAEKEKNHETAEPK